MSYERPGKSDEWYTPKYIFDAMKMTFDLDVAPAPCNDHVPSRRNVSSDGLNEPWGGFVWMNPPFGPRNGLTPWLERFFLHGNGVALTPDRTSAPWWQRSAERADVILFISPKVQFINGNGEKGKSPANGTTLFAVGEKGIAALNNARDLGVLLWRRQR